MKEQAIEKIKRTPEIANELRFGGRLLFDKKSGAIFHYCGDDKIYYQKWSDEAGGFSLIEWQCGGLDEYDLEVIEDEEIQAT